jgi:hypothetical protein
MLALMMALALAGASDIQGQGQRVYDATFRPLKGSERAYSDLGPAGPYYPERAANARVNGQAILSCRVAAGGDLEGCKPVAEMPVDSSFGVAARVMADRKRIFVENAPPPGQTILVRVSFVIGSPAQGEP